MNSTIIKAPAKINLYLDVVNKRPDGYRNIETIFERIDLCDWIRISVIPKGIKLICPKDLIGINNTAHKAAKLLIEKYNLNCGFKIEIDKRIPVAAGLGGGSSDGASTLLGINDLLNLKITKKTMLDLALNIGADAPFFVSGYKRALGTGVGNELLRLKQQQRLYFLLIYPNIRISSAYIYNNTKLGLTKKGQNANIFRHYLENLSLSNIKHILFNKLEEAILPSYPVLRDIKTALKRTGAEGVLVSGSGSTVFGMYKGRKGVLRAESKLCKKGNWQLFLARSH